MNKNCVIWLVRYKNIENKHTPLNKRNNGDIAAVKPKIVHEMDVYLNQRVVNEIDDFRRCVTSRLKIMKLKIVHINETIHDGIHSVGGRVAMFEDRFSNIRFRKTHGTQLRQTSNC